MFFCPRRWQIEQSIYATWTYGVMLNRGYWVLQKDATSQWMWYGVISGIINYE